MPPPPLSYTIARRMRARKMSGVVDSSRTRSPTWSASAKSSSEDSSSRSSSSSTTSSGDGALQPGQSCPSATWGAIFPR